MEIENNVKRLAKYIKKNISKGYTLDSLRWALVSQGYSRPIIERAIEQANKELAEQAPIIKEKPVIEHQIIDENNNSVNIKKSLWERIVSYFKESY